MKTRRSLLDLRERAEEVLREGRPGAAHASAHDMAAVGTLIHELDVYSAELEMQNESLRQAQDEIAASRERYFELFRNAPLGYLVLDQDGIVIDANAAALAQFGRARADFVGRPLTPMLARECRTAFARLLLAACGELRRGACELLVGEPSAGGRSLHAEAVLVPHEHEAEGRRQVLCATLDVSERRRVELALARSEEKYRSLFETSRDALLLVTRAGAVVEGNPAACQLLGLAPAELASKRLTDLVAVEDLVPVMQLVSGELSSGELVECSCLRADGRRVPAEASAARVHADLFQLIVRDTTERARAAEERGRLAAKVHQAQRLEALGKLAGGIAHDMNNVLAAVLAIGSDLHETMKGHPAREDLATIVSAARRGADLTRGLLAFARGDPAPHRPLAIADVCRGVVALVGRTAPRNVRVVAELSDEELVVDGDAGALGQLVLNLCVNSIDAMPDGGELRIEASPSADGREVRVGVRDTGQGMDADTLAHAFDPFFTTKPTGKGTGLGLAMVYGTARGHGGSVAITSEPGRGTSVELVLPRSKGRVTVLPEAASPRSPAPRRRALVVDDEPLVLRGVAKLLKKLGFEPSVTLDPKHALEKIDAEGPFALYVFDVNMPDLDGIALARRLIERDPEARVLFMSGYNPQRVPEELTARPTIHFVPKPFDMSGLFEAVRVLLG